MEITEASNGPRPLLICRGRMHLASSSHEMHKIANYSVLSVETNGQL